MTLLKGSSIKLRVKLTVGIALLILLTGLQFGLALQGKEESAEHYVHVRFVGENGQTVRGLKIEEIEISTYDGEDLEITRMIEPDTPFQVGLLMDVSPSTEEDVNPIRQATSDFVGYFPKESEILVLTFDDEVYIDCDWTTDRKKVDEAIWEYGLHKPGGSTILRDAVVSSIQQKFMDKRPRVALVLFTDGVDTGSDYIEENESIDFLSGAEVLTFVVQHFDLRHHWRVNYPSSSESQIPSTLPPPTSGPTGPIFVGRTERDIAEYKVRQTYERASGYVSRLGNAGGGGAFHLASLDELPKAYSRIASELMDSYTIGFLPANRKTKEKVRKIRVRTSREDVIAYVKPGGYWAQDN